MAPGIYDGELAKWSAIHHGELQQQFDHDVKSRNVGVFFLIIRREQPCDVNGIVFSSADNKLTRLFALKLSTETHATGKRHIWTCIIYILYRYLYQYLTGILFENMNSYIYLNIYIYLYIISILMYLHLSIYIYICLQPAHLDDPFHSFLTSQTAGGYKKPC